MCQIFADTSTTVDLFSYKRCEREGSSTGNGKLMVLALPSTTYIVKVAMNGYPLRMSYKIRDVFRSIYEMRLH